VKNLEYNEAVNQGNGAYSGNINKLGAQGNVVGRGFDSRCGYSISQLTQSFQPHCGLGVSSASNRNEYQESSWDQRVAVA
jgi:hypothetical protein